MGQWLSNILEWLKSSLGCEEKRDNVLQMIWGGGANRSTVLGLLALGIKRENLEGGTHGVEANQQVFNL